MNKKLKEKIMESLSAVLPITLIVLLLSITVTPMAADILLLFLVGAVMLIVGMGLFSLGADTAMMPIGELSGEHLTKTKKLSLIILSCFIIGIAITIAEPDLQVLADQMPTVPNMTLIVTVAIGVGVFLVLAFLRIFFRWRLNVLLMVFYGIIFVVSFFVPNEFIAVAFDSGGVTTGPITVPFIMALGLGLTSVRSDKNADDDSFGLVALCSVGPILSMLILGMLYNSNDASYTPLQIPVVATTRDLIIEFGRALPHYGKEVLLALVPIVVIFLVLQLAFFKLRRRALLKIFVGLLYTLAGLTLFLTGVNVGFMPVGYYMGNLIAGLSFNWILVPIGMLIGYFIVKAEPAVLVLNKQVENITGGAISQNVMMTGLSIGMAASVGLAIVRVLTGLSIYWLILPGYVLALGLSFRTSKIFTAIAFDSGGVASGPMTATFLLPFAMGACDAVGGNILTDAFGIVAMVAMTPLITIQLLGVVYRFKAKKEPAPEENVAEEIIDFSQEESLND